jgi:hypothetical protein
MLEIKMAFGEEHNCITKCVADEKLDWRWSVYECGFQLGKIRFGVFQRFPRIMTGSGSAPVTLPDDFNK